MTAYIDKKLIQILSLKKNYFLWRFILYILIMLTAVSESQLIVGLLQWKTGFKLHFFYLKSKSLLVFFIWSKMAKGSLGFPPLASERNLSGP